MSTTAAEQTIDMEKKTTTEEPKPRRAPRRGIPLDWVAGHGPVSAPVAMATTATAVASLGAWTGLPAALPLGVGAVGALVHGGIQGHRRGMTRSTMLTRATGWLLASGWTSVVIATDPTTWTSTGWWTALGTLAASAIGIGGALHQAEVHEEAADEERRQLDTQLQAAEVDRADRELVKRWMSLVRQVTHRNDITWTGGFERRPNDSGFAFQVSLPLGYPLTQLQGCASTLAQAARLEQGCLVRIGQARLQGEAILDIDLRNTNREEVVFPGVYTPLSIYQGMPWGVDRSGEEIKVHVRESCALIVGPPGAGKTTLLDGIFASSLRCTDLLLWGIDLGKEGGAFRPWLETYREGQLNTGRDAEFLPPSTRPAFDWVASNEEEAELMLAAAERISDARIAGYQDLMREADARGSLPLSAKVPMIVIVVDEGVQILSELSPRTARGRLAKRIKDIIGTDREAGIRTILTATDGNLSSIGDTVISKHSTIRVAMTSTDPTGAGVNKLFGHVKGLDARQLTAKGSGVIGQGGEPGFAPQPFRSWKTKPSMAREACLATERLRPRLDAVSVQAGGADYTERWSRDRTGWLFKGSDGQPLTAPPASAPSPTGPVLKPPTLFSRSATGAGVSAEEREVMEQVWGDFLDSLPEVPKEEPGRPQVRPPRLFSRPTEGQPATPQPAPAGEEGDWKQAALRIVQQAGSGVWLSTSEVRTRLEAEGIEIGRQALSAALSEMLRKGQIARRGTGAQTEYGPNA
ncbi:ATP-binding protein [Streptomyces sp. NRRL S-495]|uniref:ATP-binding protein n=1 Tax=Streptomyces sp. NRRL S-495 TaxID=1609133 RepID=UPI000695AE5D|nr:ATP-binding protein [Streptomyces sp. NRRL S-495]